MSALQKWIVSLAGVALASVISFQWLDRPVALFFHRTVARPETFARLRRIKRTWDPDNRFRYNANIPPA